MPDSEEASVATVIGWYVEVGASVRKHQPLLEVSTDKVTLEVDAPADGKLVQILVEENQELHPGHILGKIDPTAPGADDASTEPEYSLAKDTRETLQDAKTGNAGSRETRLSPLVRRMLADNNLDATQIIGTGRDGRITARDVEQFLSEDQTSANPELLRPIEGRIIPHTAMRRKIADHMVESMLKTSPHVTAIFDADMSAIIAHRNQHRDSFRKRGVNLTYTAYFTLAAARTLRKNPVINSRWHDEGVEILSDVNIGIATALGDKGLIVPVVENADTLSLSETAAELNYLVERARNGKLTREDVEGGTFTITNHGVSGSLIATPIINQPQAAILGIGKTMKRVVVDDSDGVDSIQVRPMVYITLTIDHRILDGFQANQFLNDYVSELENWT